MMWRVRPGTTAYILTLDNIGRGGIESLYRVAKERLTGRCVQIVTLFEASKS